MNRLATVILVLAAPVLADREADMAIALAIRDFNWILAGRSHGSIEGVRDRIIANFSRCSPKVAKSIRFQLDRGFNKKYKQSAHFYKCTAQALASGGKKAINKLSERYRASKKRNEVRLAIVEALGECGDEDALDALLKMAHDKLPEVAAAAVRGCGNYGKVKVDKRKKAMRALIDHYAKITDQAAGKQPDSVEMHMYKQVKPEMDKALKAFSGGEALDSAQAWDAWLRDNMTKPWPE